MGKDDMLLVTGSYPHALMQHMNTLVKERGRSILWDGSFVQLFENAFPDMIDEKFTKGSWEEQADCTSK